MMQMRDWISGLVGAVLVLIGISSFWSAISFLNNIFSAEVLRWIIVIGAVYLAWNSIIEVTNSNIVGWWSFGAAAVSLIIGLLPSLPWFHFSVFSSNTYNIILVVEGVLLIIATFAMEL